MRLKAAQKLGIDTLPCYVLPATTPSDKLKAITVKDNIGYGEWDWSKAAEEWDLKEFKEWGANVPDEWMVGPEDFGDNFTLKDGDKDPFQHMGFILADEQAEYLKTVLSEIKDEPSFKETETFGNENSNGNALYFLAIKWEELKK